MRTPDYLNRRRDALYIVFGIDRMTEEAIVAKRRDKSVAAIKFAMLSVMRAHGELSSKERARVLFYKDHTSAMHGERKAKPLSAWTGLPVEALCAYVGMLKGEQPEREYDPLLVWDQIRLTE